jgi:hypothetical protein
LTGATALAANQQPPDSKAEVPALASFHEVIYVIWHEAWPAKDTARLKGLLPEIEKKTAEIEGAKLPGILHHREAAWREGVDGLKAAVEEYRKAVQKNDDPALLAAAEELHARFEQLARTIRPAVRELEDFHSSLYVLYHHYLPDYQIEKIREASAELKQKMPPLAAVTLPQRLSDKQEAFNKARQELAVAVDQLAAVVQSGDEPTVRKAVEEVHSRYEATAASIGAN